MVLGRAPDMRHADRTDLAVHEIFGDPDLRPLTELPRTLCSITESVWREGA